MKFSILFLALVVLTLSSYSQNPTDTIPQKDTLASLKPTLKTDSLVPHITLKYWDSLNFNPYRNTIAKWPFKITFKDSVYASPITTKKMITSRYGWRKGRPHKGIDIDLVTGDTVRAMLEGIVRFARYSRGHGKTIIVRHYNGLETAYAHLSAYAVKVNDTVKAGQMIGKGGVTGNARGSHLHLVTSFEGNYINPEYIFDFGETNTIRRQAFWITEHWVKTPYHSSKKQSELEFFDTYESALAYQKQQNRAKIYVVKRGDTLSEISGKHHISLSRLCKINRIRTTSVLKIGQKIVINY